MNVPTVRSTDWRAYPLREIALCNIAFAHGQLGHGTESIEWYKKAVNEFPGSEIAETALAFAQGFEQ